MFGRHKSRRPTNNSVRSLGKGKYYRKNLILILLIASIPGLITGLLMYWFVGSRIEEEMVQLHKKQISKRAENLDAQFAHLELTMSHLAFEPLFDFRLLETDFNHQFEIPRDITKTLMVMEGSMVLTSKLEFYLGGANPVQFTPNFSVMPDNSDPWKQIEALIKQGPPVYWTTQFPPVSGKIAQQELSLVHKMPGAASNPYGILVARMDPDQLQSLLRALTPYEEGEAFLLQEDGSLLASTENGASSTLLQGLKMAMTSHSQDASSFIWKWGGQKYFVSFGQFERISTTWTYVTAAPINAIIRPVVFFSKLVIEFSCAGLLLAAVLA